MVMLTQLLVLQHSWRCVDWHATDCNLEEGVLRHARSLLFSRGLSDVFNSCDGFLLPISIGPLYEA